MIKSLAHLMLGPDSESDPNIMGDDSSDDMGEDGGKSDSDESRLEREAAELLQEFNEIEDRYRQYTRARSDEGENGDTEVEPTVTLHATMLSGETACVEVMNIETVKMIKDQLMTKFKLIPTSQTTLICDNQVLRDNELVAQFPCHKVTIIVKNNRTPRYWCTDCGNTKDFEEDLGVICSRCHSADIIDMDDRLTDQPNVASPTEDFSDHPRLIDQGVRVRTFTGSMMPVVDISQIHGLRIHQLLTDIAVIRTQSALRVEYEENTRAMVTEMRGEISGLLAAQLVHQMQTSTDIRHLRREVQALRDEYKVLRKQMDQQLKVNFTTQRRGNSADQAIKAIRENLEDVQRLLNAALPNIRSELEVLRDCMREEI